MVENGNYTKLKSSSSDNHMIPNGNAHGHRPDPQINANGETLLDLNDVSYSYPSPGQKCFGEKSDVERVLDSRCPCLQYKCLHLSGTFLIIFIFGGTLVICFRHYLKDFLQWLEHVDGWVSGLIFMLMFMIVSFPMTWGYIVLNVAAGYLYGFLIGVLTVTFSVLVGVATSLVVCRIFISDFVHSKLQSEHLKAIIRVVESRRGFKVIVLTRLTPIPFGLQNGLFAVSVSFYYNNFNINISKLPVRHYSGFKQVLVKLDLPRPFLTIFMHNFVWMFPDAVMRTWSIIETF